jgi:hypothetical protein
MTGSYDFDETRTPRGNQRNSERQRVHQASVIYNAPHTRAGLSLSQTRRRDKQKILHAMLMKGPNISSRLNYFNPN